MRSVDDIRRVLVSIVSDRTGYPPDMLGIDRDIEAELGIDSIKPVVSWGAAAGGPRFAGL